ncbi:urease accessory protein [Palleronia marisminoris]|uniref:Urease accessory protein UreD n=1 Tax=Palleronia marisminoris TaxID=315423 RepID=A0A1Y5RZX7_9RHOB|nr:urease accessory protein UreD [Palleronia marisminoris]SFG40450.1 urease accessory protein [Palleronia marisminoris]SLN28832.1 Urease accessory protein UreD [Palleronia marisminoris]
MPNMLADPVHQRSRGHGRIVVGPRGLTGLRQEGSARIGLPHGPGSMQAVLVNTSGGMTSGDRMLWEAEAGADLTLTTQACERIYRCDDDSAETTVRLTAGTGARLAWLPQETLLFEGARYRRRIEAEIAPDAELLVVEPLLFGRLAMGETVRRVELRDDWRLARGGRLLHAEALRLATDDLPAELEAAAQGACALATVVFISARAEGMLAETRRIIGQTGGASVIGDKLVCRLMAPDGYELRKRLVPLVSLLAGDVPRLWRL